MNLINKQKKESIINEKRIFLFIKSLSILKIIMFIVLIHKSDDTLRPFILSNYIFLCL